MRKSFHPPPIHAVGVPNPAYATVRDGGNGANPAGNSANGFFGNLFSSSSSSSSSEIVSPTLSSQPPVTKSHDDDDDARTRTVTTRRRRSFVSSRIWLFVVNLLVILIAAVTLFIGAAMHRFARAELRDKKTLPTSTSATTTFDLSVTNVAFSILSYGFCMALTGIFGAAALILRNRSLLTFYLVGLSVVFLLTAGGGGYALYHLEQRIKGWSAVDHNTWVKSSNADRALAQWVFGCCGYARFDDAPYLGPAIYAAESGESVNKCAVVINATLAAAAAKASDSSSSPSPSPPAKPNPPNGCQPAGFDFWSDLVKSSGIVLGISLIFVLISIGAAAQLKRKEDARNRYFQIEEEGGNK
ncbi:Tetraspanin family-domain-containing protein [Zopfochytrium polystomum]|nr:Tetraspanin family-domain-containing protein [Zopfochytrium polystomum]